MTKETKAAIVAKFARKEGDVGSPEVQVALLSQRITELTEHLRMHKKDHSTRRGLIAMVNQRRKLLQYFNRKNHAGYLALIKELGLKR